jgi:hypothetical protein
MAAGEVGILQQAWMHGQLENCLFLSLLSINVFPSAEKNTKFDVSAGPMIWPGHRKGRLK